MAVKRKGAQAGLAGEELKKILRMLEQEERGSLTLGETNGPLLDLYETSDSIVIEADLPGIDPADAQVYILNGILTIEGVKKEAVEPCEKVNYLCVERSFEPFRRVVKITVPINPKKGRASYARGVLMVSFPKVKEQRGETIKIKVERET